MLMHQNPAGKFGAELIDGAVRFRLWAPRQQQILIAIDGHPPHPMERDGSGWHEFVSRNAKAGSHYNFVLDSGLEVPDPASRFQPHDIHGPSEVIDPEAFRWSDSGWAGRPWEEAIIYELHVGAFTQEGTFAAAIARLDWLADLGVTAIELMPVADFPGDRNWGYDGVLLFAPDSSYGRPEDLKALIDAAHHKGLMVFLDVVYNHFGPDGNYLPSYSPIFNDKHETPWGAAVNYDAEGSAVIRQFIIENAVYWIDEFHFDGLRLDAVHAIKDDSDTHILEDIANRVRSATKRPVHLILENEENQASLLERGARDNPVRYTAQWNDDVHHVLHTAASGESAGYYRDYAGNTELLGKALAEGFGFQGGMMEYRGRARGEPSRHLPPTSFVAFIQNHDQVGNRAFGDRLASSAPVQAVRAIAAVYLLLPQIPMLFMGEEFGATQPFTFFCDFDEKLADAVREGRRAEFSKFPEFQDARQRELIPDPTARETFLSTKLRWDQIASGAHAHWHDWYRRILAVRHAEIIPRLQGIRGDSGRYKILGDRAVQVRWQLGEGSQLNLVANLKDTAVPDFKLPSGHTLWRENSADNSVLEPWSVVWSIGDGKA